MSHPAALLVLLGREDCARLFALERRLGIRAEAKGDRGKKWRSAALVEASINFLF